MRSDRSIAAGDDLLELWVVFTAGHRLLVADHHVCIQHRSGEQSQTLHPIKQNNNK